MAFRSLFPTFYNPDERAQDEAFLAIK